MGLTAIEIKRTEQVLHFQGAVESDEATTSQLLHNSNVESEDEEDKSDLEEEILKEKVTQIKRNSHILTLTHADHPPCQSEQKK